MASFAFVVLFVLHLAAQTTAQGSSSTTLPPTNATAAGASPTNAPSTGTQSSSVSSGQSQTGNPTTTVTTTTTTTVAPGANGGKCDSSGGCSGDSNAECKNSNCVCKEDFAAPSGRDCKLKLNSKANCTGLSDCGFNMVCNDTVTGKCQCDSSKAVKNTYDFCGLKAEQSGCHRDDECVDKAHCEGGTCKCLKGHKKADNTCSKAGRAAGNWILFLVTAVLTLISFH